MTTNRPSAIEFEAPSRIHIALATPNLERARAFIETVRERGFGLIELDLVCKDGRTIPMEYKVAVLNNKSGESPHIISIGRDVTERRRADEALRVQRERLVRFMDSATDSFHLVDSELRIVEMPRLAASQRDSGSRAPGSRHDWPTIAIGSKFNGSTR